MTASQSISIRCPRCQLHLWGDENRCPQCRKWLHVPYGLLPVILGAVVLITIVLVGRSDRLQTMMDARRVRPADVYEAACRLVGPRVLLRFGDIGETEIDKWQGGRWRITGYMLHEDSTGFPAKTIYQCVLLRGRGDWVLEDLRLEAHR